MTDRHAHHWSPVAGERARYACACSATGYRNSGGTIHAVEHAPEIDPDARISARPIADYRTGRVRARILDDEDFWENQTEL